MLDGTTMSLLWAIPFAGILLSIATLPLAAPHFWHAHFGKISALWAGSVVVAMLAAIGLPATLHDLLHTALLEYLPFLILLLALFTLSGGVRMTGRFEGTPAGNTGVLVVGTLLASWMGTTGAAMLLIRPLLKANAWRSRTTHTYVFFIFLVANVGGSLTPLGDPPLFLGFLQGVPFFWPLRHMLAPASFLALLLLATHHILDRRAFRREDLSRRPAEAEEPFGIDGGINLLLILGVVGAVLLSGIADWGTRTIGGIPVPVAGMVRDGLLLLLAAASLLLTERRVREANDFDWFPIQEVAKLFAGIFVTILPVLAILRAGEAGALGGLVSWVAHGGEGGGPNVMGYFWATGVLSAFLDNAPTYLVFFNIAGGGEALPSLLNGGRTILVAISTGAVFFGAGSYIGNAPNFMVRSIVENSGTRMPSFFGYIGWATLYLLPALLLTSLLFLG